MMYYEDWKNNYENAMRVRNNCQFRLGELERSGTSPRRLEHAQRLLDAVKKDVEKWKKMEIKDEL